MNNAPTYQLKQGTILNDKWIVLEPVGKGGMGEVYRAHQLNLKRDVAIKILSSEMLQAVGEGGATDVVQRFRREVQAMAQITHPNILQIFDYDCVEIEENGVIHPIEFIVMEYVPGATLRHTMSDEGFYPDQGLISGWIREFFLPVLDGVQVLHESGLVHRDLKPENVLISGDIPKITDFGLARSSWLKPVTQSVDMHGTVPYMPPEQFISFKRVDQRADIYALGKILYEAVEGRMTKECIPFKQAQLKETPTPFMQKLDQLIRQSTAENPEERPKSVAEFKAILLEIIASRTEADIRKPIAPSPPLRYFRKWGATALIALLVFLIGTFLWYQVRKNWDVGHQVEIGTKGPPKVSIPSGKTPDSFVAEDGIRMVYLPGGAFAGSTGASGQIPPIRVSPFYMDEIRVTQHHYVDFLNEIKEKLMVDKGLVKWNNQIWLLLGEGENARGNIFFEHGRFHLRQIDQAHLPITRITWFGAKAYAEHYGKRLPTPIEWEYIFSLLESLSPEAKKTIPARESQPLSHETMMSMHAAEPASKSPSAPALVKPPVDLSRLNELVRDMTGPIGEWAQSGNEADAYPSVVMMKTGKNEPAAKKLRYPWEASAQLGFRAVTKHVPAP